jgi:hypothetical protein
MRPRRRCERPKAALKQFQKSEKLTETGLPGTQTVLRLLVELAARKK